MSRQAKAKAKAKARVSTGASFHNTSSSNANDFEEDFHEDVGTQIIDDIYMPPPPVHPNLKDEAQLGKRLIIENIENTNFKSYGGHTTLGNFHKSFNAIVGPNGSGKSNVIDSMLFVFGYRAQKLRSAKISNLIFKSDTCNDCPYAKVKVNFAMLDDKGGEEHDIVPGTRFSISRVVERNNNSYYMIDETRVQFREVSKKLQDFGIDLRYNRFLILQGEVEQISLMKPKAENPKTDTGMLEYLEDIIGTSRYKDPIEKLSEKYSEFNEKRTTFYNRVAISQKELKSIGESKDEAVRAFELENRKKIARSKIVQHHLFKVAKSLEKYEAEYAVEKAKLDAMDKQVDESEAKKVQLDQMDKEKSKELTALQANRSKLKAEFDECKKQDYYFNQKKIGIKEKKKKLKKQIETEKAKFEELQRSSEVVQDNTEIEALQAKQLELQEQLKQVDEQMKTETVAVQQECSELIREKDEIDRRLMEFKSQQQGKLDAMNVANSRFSLLQEEAQQKKDRYEATNSKLTKVQEETVEKEALIKRYEREIPDQEVKFERLTTEFNQLEQQQTKLSDAITTKNEELQILKREANKAQSRDQLVNAINSEMKHGRLQGVLGRLGQLGAIDQKYDVAISTACGRLQNFVVDTLDNAVKVLKFVKDNQLGYITTIALDKLPSWTNRYEQRRSFPEDVPRLFDLVKVSDEQIRPAFYFALSDTLVADNLEQATRIAYGSTNYRMVTLKGEMIELDGAMSGGGRPRSGGMGASISASQQVDHNQIATLEGQVEQLRAEREQINYQVESTRKDLMQLDKDLKIMREKLSGYRLDIANAETRLEQLRVNVEQQRAESEAAQANPDIPKAEEEYKKCKEIYEIEKKKMVEMEDELSKYAEQIQEKLDSRLVPIRKQKKSLDKRLKEAQTQLSKIASDRKGVELNLGKAEEALKTSEATLKELKAELEKIVADIAELEIRAKNVADAYEAAKEQHDAFQSESEAIQKEVKAIDEHVKRIKNDRLDLSHAMEKNFKVLDEKRAQSMKYQSELDALALDKIDDLDDSDSEDDDSEDGGDEDVKALEDEPELIETQQANEGDEQSQQPQEMDTADVDTEPLTTEVEAEIESTEKGTKRRRKKKEKKPQQTLPQLTHEQLLDLDIAEIERAIERLDAELKKLSPNFAAIDRYREKRAEHKGKIKELREITARRDTYLDHMKDTKARRLLEFKKGFVEIARKLKELYRTITLGGDADLEFIDSLDPFSEGINFAVRPNKKSWKNNLNLSGGEKTLASLALIFALHHYKPSPLYIMDEIDAALDFMNVSIIANYIKSRTRNTQFLIISLRPQMYELAELMVGIYKTNNISRTIAFDPIACTSRLEGIKTGDVALTFPSSQLSGQPFEAFFAMPSTSASVTTNGFSASQPPPLVTRISLAEDTTEEFIEDE